MTKDVKEFNFYCVLYPGESETLVKTSFNLFFCVSDSPGCKKSNTSLIFSHLSSHPQKTTKFSEYTKSF
jgi:hypothetical protein